MFPAAMNSKQSGPRQRRPAARGTFENYIKE
jgi:hypothetical protein